MTLATKITLGRVAAVPLIVWLYLTGHATAVLIVFLLASLSDYADGWVARRYGQQSRLGAMLDQISDKLLVITVLLLLVSGSSIATWGGMMARFNPLAPPPECASVLGAWGVLAAAVIVAREIWVSGLREYLGSLNVSVPVSRVAKYKTAAQMLAISLLLLAGALPAVQAMFVQTAGKWTLVLAAALAAWTGGHYTWMARKHLAAGS